MITPPGYLTIEQVAERLRCSKSAVYRLIAMDGLVSHVMRGHERGMVIKESELDRWLLDKSGGTDED